MQVTDLFSNTTNIELCHGTLISLATKWRSSGDDIIRALVTKRAARRRVAAPGSTPSDAPCDLSPPQFSPPPARHSQLRPIALARCMTPRSECTYLHNTRYA